MYLVGGITVLAGVALELPSTHPPVRDSSPLSECDPKLSSLWERLAVGAPTDTQELIVTSPFRGNVSHPPRCHPR